VIHLARMAKKRGPGRPGFGVTESVLTIRIPETLRGQMEAEAKRQQISASEAWRRAARTWLGLKPDAYEQYLEGKED
jgi:hypothetical protein